MTGRMAARLARPVRAAMVLVALSLVLVTAGCDDTSGRSEAYFIQKADAYRQAGNLKASVIELKNALQKNPKSAPARLLLGQIYVDVGDGASAEKELRRARDLGADSPVLTETLGRAWLLQGKYKDLLREMVSLPTQSVKTKALILTLRGRARLGLDQPDKAAGDFEAALKAAPDFAPAHVGLARVALVGRDEAGATAHLAKARDLAPESRDVLILAGDMAFIGRDYGASEKAFGQLTKAVPDNVSYRIGLARAEVGAGKLKDAATSLDAILKVHPDLIIANYLRALTAFQSKDYETARTHVQDVLKINPTHPGALLISGAANYALGNYELAVSSLQRFLTNFPENEPGRRLLAAAQIGLGRSKAAMKTLKPMLKELPDDAQILTAVGAAAVQGGDLASGSRYFTKAVALRPDDARLRAQLGVTKIALGQRKEGIKDLEKAIEIDPGLSRAEIAVIVSHLKASEFDKALEGAQRLQKKLPNSPAGFTLAGLAYVGKGMESEARTAFKKALDISPGDPSAANNLAALMARRGNLDAARKVLDGVLKGHPGHLRTLLALARLEGRAGNQKVSQSRLEEAVAANPDALLPRVFLGRMLLLSADPLKALSVSRAGLKTHPDDPALLEIVGTAQLAVRQPDDAVASFRRLVKAKPNSANAHYLLAAAYEAKGDVKGLKTELEETLRLDPNQLAGKIAMARFDVLTNKGDEAKKLLAELKQKNADNPNVIALDALLALKQNRPKDAVVLYKKALEKRPTTKLTVRLARAQWQAGDRAGGAATLEKWIKKFPGNIAARFELGMFYQGMNRLTDARDVLAAIVKKAPNNWVARNDLAWVLLRLGDSAAALTQAKRAYDLVSGNPLVADTLALAYLDEGQAERSVRLLQRASKSVPKRLDIRFHLARALAANGDKGQARTILRDILTGDRAFNGRKEAQALLNKLGG